MSAVHTPGPWTANFDHQQNACAHVRASNGYNEVATVFVASEDGDQKRDENGCWPDQPVRDANARLIAAAPDMLAALQELLAVTPAVAPAAGMLAGIVERHRAAIDGARAAIAKATGDAA